MSAETLRRAAAALREERLAHPVSAFADAVADWLENAAGDATYERARGDRTPTLDALTVARAYLGEDS